MGDGTIYTTVYTCSGNSVYTCSVYTCSGNSVYCVYTGDDTNYCIHSGNSVYRVYIIHVDDGECICICHYRLRGGL